MFRNVKKKIEKNSIEKKSKKKFFLAAPLSFSTKNYL